MNIFALFFVLLCLKSSATEDNPVETSTLGVTDSTTQKPLEVKVEHAVNNFGYNLLRTMMKHNENQSIVISPTSVAGLLGMVLLGSAGNTYDEIAQLIGFTQDILANREYHEVFGSKLQSLNANDTRTLFANGAFVDADEKLRDVYRAYLWRVYLAEARPVDFGDGAAAKHLINEWIKNNTENRIEDFLKQPLPVSTKAVLASALYFSGQWAAPFVPEYTNLLPFQTPTKEVLVELMANFGQFNYIFSYDDGLQMIALPYNDSVTTMYVLKPRFPKRQNLSELMEKLDYQKIDSLIAQMSMRKCVIRFPKMKMSSKVDLRNALTALGARSMFTPGVANFAVMLESNKVSNNSEDELLTRIASGEGEARTLKDLVNKFPNPGVHVDSVVHEVKMTIDEYGTEAVAATTAIMARTAEIFYADSPFYLFIRNERTKLVTFSAVVFDPTL